MRAPSELGSSRQASWSAQCQLAAREMLREDFTLIPDMVHGLTLGTKATEVKWPTHRMDLRLVLCWLRQCIGIGARMLQG